MYHLKYSFISVFLFWTLDGKIISLWLTHHIIPWIEKNQGSSFGFSIIVTVDMVMLKTVSLGV